jgi:hypothetical protein
MSRLALFVLPLALACSLARADGESPAATAPANDVVVLKDGRRLEGEVVAEDDRFVSVKSGGVTRAYAKDSISSIEKSPRPAGTEAVSGGAAPAQPGTPPAEPPKGKGKGKGEKREPPPLTVAGKKWLDDLIARSSDADETVRRSIAAAVGALGPSAVPVLRAARDAAPEGSQKQFLDRLAGEIEQRRAGRMRGEGDGMDGPPGPGRGGFGRRAVEDTMQRLSAELELTEDQKPKVEPIVQDWMKQRMEIDMEARRSGLSQEQMAEKVGALHKDVLVKMKGVLTDAQFPTFEEMANRLFEMQKGMGPMPPKPQAPEKPAEPGEPMKQARAVSPRATETSRTSG